MIMQCFDSLAGHQNCKKFCYNSYRKFIFGDWHNLE